MTDSDALVPVVGADGRDYVVIPAAGVAVERWCPHKGADLAEGPMIGNAIKCPLHGYMFDVASGKGLNCRYSIATVHAEWDGEKWLLDPRQ